MAGARVLIVDDSEDARLLFAEVLGRDFSCETASDGEEALRLLREGDFDALVLDLAMPVMDGWAVLEALRADPDLAALPTVVLTGDFHEETELRARSLGAVAYVAKPVFNNDLVHVVARALKG